MKFERQKNSQGITNKVEINNQQFLTFRNAQPNQNTGRSVYSQQFDYRSLQKCFKEQEQDAPAYNFRKNLKNIRSQDKYKQLQQEAIMSLGGENGENNRQMQRQRNEQLNRKLELLMKNVKKAKKKQGYYLQQISTMEILVKQNSKQISKNKADIQQLSEIFEENQSVYDQMAFKLQEYKQRAQMLTKKLTQTEESIESQINMTQSSGQSVVKLPKKLSQGIKELQKMRDQFQKKISFFQQQIGLLQQKLCNLQIINKEIRNLA